jgi:hypothetical protein
MDPDVQGDTPQGTESPGIFDSYLQAVPEDARETVTSYLKDAEKNVNERLAEASEIKKAWEPYQQVEALKQYPPEQLSELLAWHQQVTQSDDAFQQWLANAAQEAGLTPAQEEALEDAEVQGDLTREQVQQLIEQQAQQQVQPLEQKYNELAELRAIDTTESEIRDGFARIEKEAGKQFSDEEKTAIMDLGIQEERDDWLDYGYDRWQKMGAMWQKAFVDDKAKAPQPSMTTGGQQAFKPTTDFDEAKIQMKERWRQMQT